ncbi:MAG TPA: hypothetical protein VK980_05240 [Sphingomonas sp.]|nr:hypothetical protein [Sphingomonas sp.]
MKICSLLAGAAMMALTIGTARAQVADPQHRQFLYFLPTGSAGATVTQQIASCPRIKGDTPKIITTISIGGAIGPDTALPLTLDARAGFLSKRSTKLALHSDGTLESFNASAEGQGGAVLSSVIKTAATVAAWSVGIPAPLPRSVSLDEMDREQPRVDPPAMYCSADVARALAELGKVRDEIDRIETASIAGGVASASTARLGRLRADETSLIATLTLRAGKGVKFNPTRAMFPVGKDDATGLLPAAPIEQWFSRRENGAPNVGHAEVYAAFGDLPGEAGFQVTLTPDRDLLTVFAGDGSSYSAAPTRAAYYRRAVPATVSVTPCMPGTLNDAGDACAADTSAKGKRASKSGDVALPQLSGLYSLSIGAGGIFGTREATIAFDAGGSPTKLEYGSASGGADIAGVIDSGAGAATTMHDARLNAIKRSAEEMTAENDLNALLAARATK